MITSPETTQSSHRDRFGELLQSSPIIPVITIERLEHAVPLAEALVAGGLRLLEITLRTPVALKAVETIIAQVPEAIVGIGTVLSEKDLALATEIGAQFALSPGATPNLLDAATAHGLPFIPGTATASELMAALAHGFNIVKFFPAVSAGGIATLKALSGPFPQVRFCPTGGINGANAKEWLSQPNVLAVGGSWLTPVEDVEQGAWKTITERVRQTLSQLSV
jgi:2-dehydro-3-deoxyphosphogluconate aldolase / (4S)-4-hydroxy-2-oxoglutarate aldolase